MMGKQNSVLFWKPEYPHRKSPDGAGDAIAIKIQGCKIWRPDILPHVHFHPIYDREKILALEIEFLDRRRVIQQSRRRAASVERVDVVTPLLERGHPVGPWPVEIGDVVDLAAKAVDLKHRFTLLARQNPHRSVKRAAGRGCPVTCICRGGLSRHAPAAGLEMILRRVARRAISLAIPPMLWASRSIGPR